MMAPPFVDAAPVAVTGMQRSGNQILGLTIQGANVGQNRFQPGTLTSVAGTMPATNTGSKFDVAFDPIWTEPTLAPSATANSERSNATPWTSCEMPLDDGEPSGAPLNCASEVTTTSAVFPLFRVFRTSEPDVE